MFGHQLFTPVTKQTSKTLGMLHHRFLTPVLEQRWRKMMTAYDHCGCCTTMHYIDMRSHMLYLNIGYTRTCFCNGKMMIKHSTVRHTWCLMVSVFPDGMNDYDVFTKTCIKLWPRYLPRRTKTRSKLGDPQTMQNRLHRWTSRGPPFVDANMVQKQQF